MTAVLQQPEKIIPEVKEFIAESEETITFYSDDSSDEYDYKDILIHDTKDDIEEDLKSK